MFVLVLKATNEAVVVYNIRNDSCGYPMFLIYQNNQWVWKSAKHFKPTL